MRITHVIGGVDPLAGGPAMVATRLAAAQAMAGHDVTIATHIDPHRAESLRRLLAHIPHWSAVRLIGAAPPNFMGRFVGGSLHFLIAAQPSPPEILHIHGVWEPYLLATARWAQQHAVPYALAPHGMLDPWSMQRRWLKKRIALAAGYRTMLAKAAFIHALNADEQQGMAPLGLGAPVEVIPNGIFVEEFDPLPAPGTFRSKHPALQQRRYILFLGRLHFKKGLDYLAAAFMRIAAHEPDAALVIAGPDDGARTGFEATIKSAGLTDRVHVVGPLFGPDKLAALVDATCFCLPSRQEGFSIAITEAMACGLPVVISDARHFPEVAAAGAGLVVPLDAGSLANALTRVLANPELRKDMGRAGRQLVLERYTWPAVARQTVAAYERALARRK